jgi:hypothetical protein
MPPGIKPHQLPSMRLGCLPDDNNDGLADLFFVYSGQLTSRMDMPEKFARTESKF